MELNDQLATLKQLHEHTEVELKSVAERYAALRESYDAAQVETTALKEKLAKVQEQCRDKDDRLASLHDEYQAKLDQCREMKLLQDDLLNSIGEAKDTERHWQDKVDVVQKQLDNALDKLATSQTETTNLAHQHAEANAVASSLKADVDSLRASDQLQTECDRMREFEALVTDRAPHRKTFTAVAEAERQLRADLHLIDAFVNTSTPHGSVGLPNQHAKGGAEDYSTPSFVEWYIVGDVVSRVAMLDQRRLPPQLVHRLPRFSSYLHQVFVAVDTLIHHVSTVDTSWKRERFNLVAARDAFESSAALIQTELDMMRQWTFQLHDELQQVLPPRMISYCFH
ncbi:hypothetical protein DYB32_000649 [Aphanomyces invadans]|uniref:Uncharacterized protein n=1 Tax=Aphanomyces invadans TaxID=157072 RepID=A0A3R6ZAM0_9STRA|nr:hypothetical protein DYB32_000649 [Aphanomyces invadans]